MSRTRPSARHWRWRWRWRGPLISAQSASLGRSTSPCPVLAQEATTLAPSPLFCPANMLFTCGSISTCLLLLLFHTIAVLSKPATPAYVTLPTLREQAAIQDAWTEQRISTIPNILKKYGVDAWLVRFLFVAAARYRSHLKPSRPSGSIASAPSDPERCREASTIATTNKQQICTFICLIHLFACTRRLLLRQYPLALCAFHQTLFSSVAAHSFSPLSFSGRLQHVFSSN